MSDVNWLALIAVVGFAVGLFGALLLVALWPMTPEAHAEEADL